MKLLLIRLKMASSDILPSRMSVIQLRLFICQPGKIFGVLLAKSSASPLLNLRSMMSRFSFVFKPSLTPGITMIIPNHLRLRLLRKTQHSGVLSGHKNSGSMPYSLAMCFRMRWVCG